MYWLAPTEKDIGNRSVEKHLWATADELRAYRGLRSPRYSLPGLGLIFLCLAETSFSKCRAELQKDVTSSQVGDPKAYHAEGVLSLSEKGILCGLEQEFTTVWRGFERRAKG
jgi:hypothetical protein